MPDSARTHYCYGSSLDGRRTGITATELSFTVGSRGTALRELTDSPSVHPDQFVFITHLGWVQTKTFVGLGQ